MKLSIYIPNQVSILWGLICSRLILSLVLVDSSWFEYIIFGAIPILTLFNMSKKLFVPKYCSLIFLWFLILLGIMIIGLSYGVCGNGIRHIISIILIMMFLYNMNCSVIKIQVIYIRFFYWLTLSFFLYFAVYGYNFGNTIPGCIVFLTFGYIFVERMDNCKKLDFCSLVNVGMFFCLAFCLFSGARTAFFVALLIILIYYIFSNIKIKYVKNISCFIFVMLFFLTVFYANITSFEWYDYLNNYSLIYFDKNIDSSRSLLWKESIGILSIKDVFIGRGTGTLPTLEHYINSSFHNTYLQLFMQNGIFGLFCVFNIFRIMWNRLTLGKNSEDVYLGLAIFTGILIYNIFETALLQNKMFLGIIQWFLIGLVINKERIWGNR